MLRHPASGHKIKDALKHLPSIAMECTVTPITRTVLRITLVLRPEFVWRDSAHGQAMSWILWAGDTENDFIYYNEVWSLTKKMMQAWHPRFVPLCISSHTERHQCSRTELLFTQALPASATSSSGFGWQWCFEDLTVMVCGRVAGEGAQAQLHNPNL
jgi:Sec63 Brl domain